MTEQTIPYLYILRIETIIRLDDIEIQGIVKDGEYELEIDQQWIPVYVCIPRINTSSKPIYRMEISSANKWISNVLKVYRRVTGDSKIKLKNSDGNIFNVHYKTCGKSNGVYVSGYFEKEPETESFPFRCRLTGHEYISGIATETNRFPKRYLHLDGLTISQTLMLIENLQFRDVLLEEVL
ncbi:hypothetical protein SAMN05421780_101107 [Flexibacter flexilis DSM 6793]|uniref:Uncharacterized protein n=1 Tax=Flexibacter flexilis DSM 6793 TaxID=927664 RepID=A0A1I1DIK4_9BACT|nr:hypothetical protein [Flexibacter flexilis]SFB72353.1 hypothetical protein SAMN05421780_101107 [Flexibacter flexilis DSM 6793]